MGLQSEIVARLRDQAMPPLAMVEAAASPEAAADRPPDATPAAIVLWQDDEPSPNRLANAVRQTVESNWAVMVAMRNVADGRGAAAASDLDTVKAAVRAALLGWQAPSASAVFVYLGGGFAGTDDSHAWFQLSYQTQEVISG
ncbi:MAG: hypothetical protein RIB84_00660 [Sneathiellaceae bacterium]